MIEVKAVRILGLPPMTDREYKIYTKRQSFIKCGDTKGLEEFDAKLAGKNQKKVEQEIKEESKEDSSK